MIKIHKPASAPKILTGRGKLATQQLCDAFDHQHSSDFDFDSSIYGAKSVKNKLKLAQNHKCGFCEAKLDHIAYGDVEHFRPKAGYRQKGNDPLQKPGYYWLAYEWDNLLFSCQICNQRYKKNLFPIKTRHFVP